MQRFQSEDRFESSFIDLLNAGRGDGHVNFSADVDGVVRSIHLFTEFNDHLYPALSFKMFMDLIGADSISVNDADNFVLFGNGEKLTEIPVDEKFLILLVGVDHLAELV